MQSVDPTEQTKCKKVSRQQGNSNCLMLNDSNIFLRVNDIADVFKSYFLFQN